MGGEMSDRAKYIVYECEGLDLALIFSNITNHSDMAQVVGKERVVGAGFVSILATYQGDRKVSICCFGESTTLKIKSRGIHDATAVARTLYPDGYDRSNDCVVE